MCAQHSFRQMSGPVGVHCVFTACSLQHPGCRRCLWGRGSACRPRVPRPTACLSSAADSPRGPEQVTAPFRAPYRAPASPPAQPEGHSDCSISQPKLSEGQPSGRAPRPPCVPPAPAPSEDRHALQRQGAGPRGGRGSWRRCWRPGCEAQPPACTLAGSGPARAVTARTQGHAVAKHRGPPWWAPQRRGASAASVSRMGAPPADTDWGDRGTGVRALRKCSGWVPTGTPGGRGCHYRSTDKNAAARARALTQGQPAAQPALVCREPGSRAGPGTVTLSLPAESRGVSRNTRTGTFPQWQVASLLSTASRGSWPTGSSQDAEVNFAGSFPLSRPGIPPFLPQDHCDLLRTETPERVAAGERCVAMAAAQASVPPPPRRSDTGGGFYGNEPSGGSMKKGPRGLRHGGSGRRILGIYRPPATGQRRTAPSPRERPADGGLDIRGPPRPPPPSPPRLLPRERSQTSETKMKRRDRCGEWVLRACNPITLQAEGPQINF